MISRLLNKPAGWTLNNAGRIPPSCPPGDLLSTRVNGSCFSNLTIFRGIAEKDPCFRGKRENETQLGYAKDVTARKTRLPSPKKRLCKVHGKPIRPGYWRAGHRNTGCSECYRTKEVPPPRKRLCKKHRRPILRSRWWSGYRNKGCVLCFKVPPPEKRLCRKHHRPIQPSAWVRGRHSTGCSVCFRQSSWLCCGTSAISGTVTAAASQGQAKKAFQTAPPFHRIVGCSIRRSSRWGILNRPSPQSTSRLSRSAYRLLPAPDGKSRRSHC